MSSANEFVIERGTLQRYLGSDVHVIVPDKVKTIGSYAFCRQDEIRSVQLPESVTKIGDCAFNDCTALERINIPEAVKSIGEGAFRNCKELQNITFAGEPEKIGLLAFYGCRKLNGEVPAVLKDWLERLREGKLTLEEGKNLYSFSKAKNVVTVKEFKNVGMISASGTGYTYAFFDDETFLVIPVSIGDMPVVKAPSKQLPENAVVYCGAEQFDKLPRSNKALIAVQWLAEDKMLREELTEKIIPFMKKYADDVAYALRCCEEPAAYRRFLDVAKPKASVVEKLVEQCAGKAEILTVLLGAGSTPKKEPETLSLDAKPKMTVTELKKLWTYQTLIIAATGEKIIELTNYKGKDKHVEIPGYIGKTRVATIRNIFPPEVESVEFPNEEIEIKCSFRNCKTMADANGFIYVQAGGRCVLTDYVGPKNITVLTVPEGVTENVYGSFRELEMREAVLPEGFVKLAGSSFCDCRNLQKVTLPESLREIGQMAFQGCRALKQLYIPEGVKNIAILDLNSRNNAGFAIYGKRGSMAEFYAEKYGNTFIEGPAAKTKMPDYLIKDGILTGYVGSGKDLVIPEDVTEIGSFAFNENSNITSLVIGGRVGVIRSYAFASCNNLTSVKIGGSVKVIEECAFQFSELKRVEMDEGVETIGEQAFGYHAFGGAEVHIPASVKEIGKDAFCSVSGAALLHVKAGSYAEQYAKENNIPFVAE